MATGRKSKGSASGAKRRKPQPAAAVEADEQEVAVAEAAPPVRAAPVRSQSKSAAPDPLAEFFVSEAELEANSHVGGDEGVSLVLRSAAMAELLAFWVADEEYAADIIEIQEIIKVPPITEVPRAPDSVLGIISLRGTIVPVVDLRVLLDLERRPLGGASRILVMRGDGEAVGLLVDQVSSVVRLDRETIEPPPRGMLRESDELLLGVGKDGDRMLIVLDLPAVLSALENAA